MVKSFLTLLILSLIQSSLCLGQPAPDFTITDSEGKTHHLYDDYLNQGKTVVVKIFFVNCPPCASIAPAFQDLYEDWGEGLFDVEFFELSNKSWDQNSDVAGWKSNYGLTFPGAGEDGGALVALQPYLSGTYGPFFGTPTFFVIAPDGSVNWDVSGAGNANTIIAIDQAISATGATKPGKENPEPSRFMLEARDAFGNTIAEPEYYIGSATTSQEYALSPDNGLFEITELQEEYPGISDPVIRIRKNDALKDKLSAIDILIIVRHILGLVPIQDSNLLVAADTNGDGLINAIDLITLQRVILGLIDSFPSSDSYQFNPSEFPLILEPGVEQTIQFNGVKIGDLNGF